MAKPDVLAVLSSGRVVTELSTQAAELFNQGTFGAMLKDGRVELSNMDALYLLEKGRIALVDARNRAITTQALTRRASRAEKGFWVRYCVFRDLRDRGYVVKTALKFGADFRVYDRGVKPGEDHAKWIVYPVRETDHLTWYSFAAKNRVAHSTKKRLLIGIVDEESDVTYYEIRWVRP